MSKNDITPERRAEAALRIAEDRTDEAIRYQRERDALWAAIREVGGEELVLIIEIVLAKASKS